MNVSPPDLAEDQADGAAAAAREDPRHVHSPAVRDGRDEAHEDRGVAGPGGAALVRGYGGKKTLFYFII